MAPWLCEALSPEATVRVLDTSAAGVVAHEARPGAGGMITNPAEAAVVLEVLEG